jgi:hypothetical protein
MVYTCSTSERWIQPDQGKFFSCTNWILWSSAVLISWINSALPHCSDAFARLYDRRMLPPQTASRQQSKAPPCVSYFCPARLSDNVHSFTLGSYICSQPVPMVKWHFENIYSVNSGALV